MTRTSMVTLIAFAATTFGGCFVTKGKYEEAVADLNGAKAELESTKAQQQRLAQDVASLEAETQEATKNAEAAAASLQQAKDDVEAERKATEDRIAKLKRTIAHLTVAQSTLREALALAKKETPALNSAVETYKAKLDDEGMRSPSFPPPPVASPNERLDTASGPRTFPPPEVTPPPPTVPPPAPAETPKPAPQPPVAKKVEPVDDSFLGAIKGWLVSLWRSVFS